jgi:hypothetical protein
MSTTCEQCLRLANDIEKFAAAKAIHHDVHHFDARESSSETRYGLC